MRGESSKEDGLLAALRERLSINHIHREYALLAHMTPRLEIRLNDFLQLELLRGVSREQLLPLLKHLPFLSLHRRTSLQSDEEVLRFHYENHERRLLVTGIVKKRIDESLLEFNRSAGKAGRVISSNHNWTILEMPSEEGAKLLQKFLRGKKRLSDLNNLPDFKIDKKRVRIIIIKEDLYALLVDAMTEAKNEHFAKHFNPQPTERRDSVDPAGYIVYRSLCSDYGKTEGREDEFSDGFSESNSLNSDMKDLARINDIIETSDQGIQAENDCQDNYYTPDEMEIMAVNNSPSIPPTLPPTLPTLPTPEETQALLISEVRQNEQQNYAIPDDTEDQQQEPPPQVETRQPHPDQNETHPIFNYHPTVIHAQLGSTSRDTQTTQWLYCSIPFDRMRRLFQEYKNHSHRQLIEVPGWLRSESEEEKARHKFYDSLCKPKIIHKREDFQ